MIIDDLNFMESVESEVVGGTFIFKGFEADVTVGMDFDSNVAIDVDKDVDVNVTSTVDLQGNTGFLVGEVTSLGGNTTSEINFAILTAPGVSEVSVTAYGASA